MVKRAKFNLERYITEQAVNFDKLPWNRKERNFALFWPTITLGMVAVAFVAILIGKELENQMFELIVLAGMTFGSPILYFAYKNYIWALIIIPVIYVSITFYQMYIGVAENPWLPLLVAACFVIPIKIEFYRRKHGLSKPQNIKKDILVGAGLFILFPLLWGLSLLLK